MSVSLENCQDLDMAEPESRESVYSPASSYSTYSHEVKYIFNPVDDSTDEYGDYSHITPRAKQNYLSHTPRTISASSQLSGKENRTPHTPRDDCVFDLPQQMVSSRTGSVLSSASRDRGPISPQMEEALYASTHYGYGPRKPQAPEHGPRDRTYYNPGADVPPYPYAKHSYPVWKQNNMNNNNNNSNNLSQVPHPPGLPKHSNIHQDTHKYNRPVGGGGGPGFNSFQNQHPLNNVHNNYHHYQQPNIHNPAGHDPSYPQQPHGQGNGQAGGEPPYPMPPRYNQQHHNRRKTWSPPALKMSLLNAGSQASRVCHSNDSLDISQEAGLERKTQSLSEDLDVTPPKLAPISGVLSQKPGPNLIKPVAYKPVHATDARSPVGHMTRRQLSTEDHTAGPHEMARPYGMKLGTSMLGMQGSPDSHNGRTNMGAFNSMAKLPHHSPGGPQITPAAPHTHSHIDNLQHPPPPAPHSHSASVCSSHSSSHHNSSVSSHHNVSANSYSNLPATSQHNLSANSSQLSAGEEASFTNDFPRPSDRPDSVPSMNASRVSSQAVEGMQQTPSPSDSGVGELEAMLREKDAEINTLREVMDRNERAIFQVYEERRNVWLHDTQEMKDDYERKLKAQSRKSYKTEQVLSLQVYKLQQEQKTLQEEKAKITNERDEMRQQVEENQNQICQLKLQLEAAQSVKGGSAVQSKAGGEKSTNSDETGKSDLSVNEELALKNKELITLKSQLHSLQVDMEKKNKEVAEKVREASSKSDQVKYLKEEMLRLKDPPALVEASSQTHVPSVVTAAENVKPSMLGERDRTITGLQEELMEIRAQVALLKEEHEKEREQWLDEKNKVVRYQKQLQLNYVQMQRKNATLETEVQQLTLELENRDMKLIALSGEESVC